MRTSFPLHTVSCLLGAFVLGASAVSAATLAFEAPLHLKPDASSSIVGTIQPGASITALIRSELEAEGIEKLPTGWVAIRHTGPLFGYAPNGDVGKDLTLKPGAIVRTEPAAGATMIAMITGTDRAEVVEIVGEWSKVVLSKSRVVFLNTLAASAPPPPTQISARAAEALQPGSRIDAPPPPPRPEPAIATATPRVFQGYLMRTRRILGAGPKLDYQLVDAGGGRIALLDLSALLLTDPLDSFENRLIGVFGPASRSADARDLVIRVETLRLAN